MNYEEIQLNDQLLYFKIFWLQLKCSFLFLFYGYKLKQIQLQRKKIQPPMGTNAIQGDSRNNPPLNPQALNAKHMLSS